MNKPAISELEKIAGKLANNDRVPPMTVRNFLGLLGEEPRRASNVIKRVRKELKKHKLATLPDFGNGNIEKLIEIVLVQAEWPLPPTEKRTSSGPSGMNRTGSSALEEIAEKLANNVRVPPMTVRDFLGLLGEEPRRGSNVIKRVRKELKKHKLVTKPDFGNGDIEKRIEIVLVQAELQTAPKIQRVIETAKPSVVTLVPEPPFSQPAQQVRQIVRIAKAPEVTPVLDPPISTTAEPIATAAEPRNCVVTIRQGIPSAGKPPATVRPDESTTMALTRLMAEKLEFLIVQSGERARVEGVFSYASFSQAYIAGKPTKMVRDCISDEFIEVNEEKSLIDAVREILTRKTVVVRSCQNKLCGVVTARDVAPVFIGLAEPFLLLGQIENHMRSLLERCKLKKDEYQALVDERDPDRKAKTEGADNLTLGELIRAFESVEMWGKVGIHFDKVTFTKRLHEVGEIRNKVMHFRPDGLPPEDVTKLTRARELLEKL